VSQGAGSLQVINVDLEATERPVRRCYAAANRMPVSCAMAPSAACFIPAALPFGAREN